MQDSLGGLLIMGSGINKVSEQGQMMSEQNHLTERKGSVGAQWELWLEKQYGDRLKITSQFGQENGLYTVNTLKIFEKGATGSSSRNVEYIGE